jgi:predicted outer membrane lipoprotein
MWEVKQVSFATYADTLDAIRQLACVFGVVAARWLAHDDQIGRASRGRVGIVPNRELQQLLLGVIRGVGGLRMAL